MSSKIIDMRSRPAFLHDFYGATPGTPEYDTARWLNRRLGSIDDEHFIRSHTIEGFIAEIQESDISRAVVVGRDTPAVRHSNDQVSDITAAYPELIGIGSVDPQRLDEKAALTEVERAITQLGLSGINLEPGFGAVPVQPDDPAFLPIYDACSQLDVPVFLMSGPTSPNLDLANPSAVGRLARQFPKLRIVCYHGFYPYVNEIIGVAFRYENVFVVPDMYIFLPGGNLYVEAANGFMREQLLFGTSYPFRAMAQSVNDFIRLGFKEPVLDALLYENARRLLKLDPL